MTIQQISLGKKGEELVCHYLKQNGFIILEQNYQIKAGEIDIIAQKDCVLAFVEVKLRQYPQFSLSEVIIHSKQQKIIKAALWYISKNNIDDMVYRFDVALLAANGSDYNINYIENAFTRYL